MLSMKSESLLNNHVSKESNLGAILLVFTNMTFVILSANI